MEIASPFGIGTPLVDDVALTELEDDEAWAPDPATG